MNSIIITSVDPSGVFWNTVQGLSCVYIFDMWRDDGADTLVVTMDDFGTTEVDDSNTLCDDGARALHPE